MEIDDKLIMLLNSIGDRDREKQIIKQLGFFIYLINID